MKRCAKCAEKIQHKAIICRFCGAEQPAPPKGNNKTLFLVCGVVLVVLFVARIGSDKRSAEPEKVADAPADPYGDCIIRGLGNKSQSFAHMVENRLRNPNSFEHVATIVGPIVDGVFPVTMKYRATNGFGAVDTYVAMGEVRVDGCGARVISTE